MADEISHGYRYVGLKALKSWMEIVVFDLYAIR